MLSRVAPALERLDLSNSSRLTEAALRLLLPRGGAGCGARLRALRLRSCAEAVTDKALCGWWPRAHALRMLDVAECTGLTDTTAVLLAASLERGGSRAPPLRRLDLTGCPAVTRRGHTALRRAQARVPSLHLVYRDCVDDGDDDAVAALLRSAVL